MSLLAKDEAAAIRKNTDKEIVNSPSIVSQNDEIGWFAERENWHKFLCYGHIRKSLECLVLPNR